MTTFAQRISDIELACKRAKVSTAERLLRLKLYRSARTCDDGGMFAADLCNYPKPLTEKQLEAAFKLLKEAWLNKLEAKQVRASEEQLSDRSSSGYAGEWDELDFGNDFALWR